MSPKSLALIAAAIGVVVMGVYLFIQVKASPAQAHATATASNGPTHQPAKPDREQPAPSPTPAPVPTARPRPEGRPIAVGNATAEPQAMAAPDEDQRANPRMDSMMELANKAYDSQDFDQAIAIATKVLAKEPTNVRMLRIMVSANCIGGDASIAQQHYERLPKYDREQMKTRCDKYQVALKDPPE